MCYQYHRMEKVNVLPVSQDGKGECVTSITGWKNVNVLPVSRMFRVVMLSQDGKGERVTSILNVPCSYAAGLSSSFKDTSSPTGGPVVVTAKLKRE